jgi:hypothetical protein
VARRRQRQRGGASARLKEAVLLIPLTFNDGTAIASRKILSIVNELYAAFSGWTKEGVVEGAYRMKTGRRRVEKLLKLSVILEEAKIPELEEMVAKWCDELDQEAMLVKITDAAVKLISPIESNDL